MPTRVRLLLPLLLTLAACKVGPDFESPEAAAPLAPRWLQAGEAGVVSDRQTYERWWATFNDPVLDRLVETAYRQNLTLLGAGTRVLEARARLGVAIGGFYPQTQGGTGSISYVRPPEADPSTNPIGSIGEFWRSSLGLSLAWELDFWGRFRRGVSAADAAYLASVASYDDVLVTLVGDVATTYLGIRTLETQLAIARANVARQRQALRIARDRFRGGAATELDVFQAENVLAQTEAAIPQLTAQLEQGRNALRVLLGMPPEPLEGLLAGRTGRIPDLPDGVAVGIPADLIRRRPDIRAVELRAAAQSERIGIARADLFPAFTLSGAFGGTAAAVRGNSLDDMFNSRGMTFAFGLNFSWPILNYGRITNEVRVQDARLQGLLIEYRDTVLRAQRDVENGIAGFLEGGRQVAALKRSAAAAQRALGIALDQYQLGTRDFTTVLTAQQNLYQAQNSLAQAEGARAIALANTFKAMGGGWQLRQGNGFVDAATRETMRARTDWGDVLPPEGAARPITPGLPGPEDRGPEVRAPEW